MVEPKDQLVQDGHCVPVSSCRCGLPSPNASWALAPAGVVRLDCRNWYECPPMATRGRGALGGRLEPAQGYGALLGPRTPPSSRVATRVSGSPLSGLKGVQPPLPFGDRTRDCSPGHTGTEGPQLASNWAHAGRRGARGGLSGGVSWPAATLLLP